MMVAEDLIQFQLSGRPIERAIEKTGFKGVLEGIDNQTGQLR